jgi:hypothetical protein
MTHEPPSTETVLAAVRGNTDPIALIDFAHYVPTGPYRPVTPEEIAEREALRAETEAEFRRQFAVRSAEIAAERAGKLTVLEEARRQRNKDRQQRQTEAAPHIGTYVAGHALPRS